MGFGTALLGARVGNGGLVCRASRAFSVEGVVPGWVWAGIGVGTEWVSCLCPNRLGFVLGLGNLVFSGSLVGIGIGCNGWVLLELVKCSCLLILLPMSLTFLLFA
jgi:hypothetical protein